MGLAKLQTYFESFASIAGARELLYAEGLVETAAEVEHVTRALGVNAQQVSEQQYAFRQGGSTPASSPPDGEAREKIST